MEGLDADHWAPLSNAIGKLFGGASRSQGSHDHKFVFASPRLYPIRPSKRFEEVHQILLLLIGEPDIETLIVEVHRIKQRRGRAVMKVRCTRRQPRRIGPLIFPISAQLPLISARPGSVTWKVCPVRGPAMQCSVKIGKPEMSSDGGPGSAAVTPMFRGALTE